MSKHIPPHSNVGGEKGNNEHDDHRRSVSRNVEVTGIIEARFPHELVSEYKRSNTKADKRESYRFIVECVTLALVFIVGIFSFIQTRETIKSAEAAVKASEISSKALYISERAYVNLGEVNPVDYGLGLVQLIFHNTGHIPSGNGKLTIHGITITCQENVTNCPSKHYVSTVRWWREATTVAIPSSNPAKINLHLVGVEKDLLTNGSQSILITGHIDYSDGFAEQVNQRTPFCFETFYDTSLRIDKLSSCITVISDTELAKHDAYPTQHHDKQWESP